MQKPYASVLIDNHPLHYRDHECVQSTGPVLIFCHGLLASSHMWQAQLDHFSKQYRCIAIDLWGHGLSTSIPESTKNLQDVANDILHLMDSLNIEQAILIGHGAGGAIAAELVLKAPTRINKLVMLNSFIGFEPQVNCVKYQGWMAQISNEQAISTTMAQLLAPLFFSKKIDRLIQADPQLAAELDAFTAQLTNTKPEHINGLLKFANMAIFKRDTLELIEQFTLPCMIAVGVEGHFRTGLEAYLMNDSIDGSKLVNLPLGGHFANIEQAVLFNQNLTDFLK